MEFLVDHYAALNPTGLPYYLPSISYKPNTDIYEESQQLVLCERLLEKGFVVMIDPCDMIPTGVRQHLIDQYQGRAVFQKPPSLDDVVEIRL